MAERRCVKCGKRVWSKAYLGELCYGCWYVLYLNEPESETNQEEVANE